MTRVGFLTGLLLIMFSAFSNTTAQDWQVVSVQPLDELISSDVQLAAVSPNAAYLGMIRTVPREDSDHSERVFCVYEFNTESQTCPALPENMESVAALVWSPDSRYITMHEDAFRFLHDSDLWLYDVAADEYHNLTDDQFDADLYNISPEDTVLLDYLPRWSGETVYFLRLDWHGEQIGLYQLAINEATLAGSGEPEPVVDLTPFVEDVFLSLAVLPGYGLNGIMDISPDGTRAAIITHANRSRIFFDERVLLIDLETGFVSLLATGSDLALIGLPPETPEEVRFLELAGLDWSGNDTLVLAAAMQERFMNGEGEYFPPPVYHIHVTSGEVVPLIDFSHIESWEELGQPAANQEFAYGFPMTSLLTPDGTGLLVGSYLIGELQGAVIYVVPVNGGEPTVMGYLSRTGLFSNIIRATEVRFNSAGVTANGIIRVLIGNVLFTFET